MRLRTRDVLSSFLLYVFERKNFIFANARQQWHVSFAAEREVWSAAKK
jgi:hypothetical protein